MFYRYICKKWKQHLKTPQKTQRIQSGFEAWWNTAHGLEDSKATPEKGVRSVSICLNTFESCLMMSSTVNVIIHIHVNYVINHVWCWHLQLAWWNAAQGLEASKATPEEVVWIRLNHVWWCHQLLTWRNRFSLVHIRSKHGEINTELHSHWSTYNSKT